MRRTFKSGSAPFHFNGMDGSPDLRGIMVNRIYFSPPRRRERGENFKKTLRPLRLGGEYPVNVGRAEWIKAVGYNLESQKIIFTEEIDGVIDCLERTQNLSK